MQQGKRGKKNNLISTSFWYVFSSFLSKGLVFLLIPIYTRLLSKAEYGEYSNFISWVSIISSILQMNLGIYVIQKQADYRDHPHQLLTNVFYAIFVVAGILLIPVLIFPNLIASLLEISKEQLWVLSIYAITVPCFYAYTSYLRSVLKVKAFVISNFLVAFLAGLFSVLALHLFVSHRLAAFVLAQTVPYILFGTAAFILSFLHSQKVSKNILIGSLQHGLPSIPHLLSITIISQIDKVMIYNLVGSEATAVFQLATTFMIILTTLTTALNNAYVPWFIEKLKAGETNNLRRTSMAVLLLFAFVTMLLCLIAPEAIFILGGKEYREALFILPPLLISSLLVLQYQVYLNIEYYLEKRKVIAYGTFFAAIAKILINIMVIKKWGYQAVGFTTFFAYLFLLIIHILTTRKLGYLYVIDQKKQWLIILGEILICFLSVLLFPYALLRYGLLFFCLVAATLLFIRKKGQIKQLLSK